MKYTVIGISFFLCLAFTANINAQIWNAAEIIGRYTVKPDTSSCSSSSVGGIPVNYDVTSTGACVLNLPIEAPSGVSGMCPDIGLAYNSQGGDGYAGYGCGISGLSVITRGAKTVYHDGAAGGVCFTDNDALYLDGKRLIQKSGKGIVNDAVYVLESDPYRVFQIHGEGTDQWISEKRQDGRTIKYGYGIGSQQTLTTLQGVSFINAWYQCYVEDKNGNGLAISYDKDEKTLYPSRIVYGRNDHKNNDYINSIIFSYEYRDFPRSYVINGIKCNFRKRIKSIETKSGQSTFRKYELSYNTNSHTHKEHLVKIDSYPGSSTDKRSVILQWADTPQKGIIPKITDIPETDYFLTEKQDRLFTAADINGDGISDLLEFAPVKVTSSAGVGSTSGYYDNYLIPYVSSVDGNGEIKYNRKNYIRLGGDINFGDFVDGTGAPSLIDMNGDGLQDVVIPNLQVVKAAGIRRVHFRILHGKRADTVDGDMDDIGIQLTNTDKFPLYSTADLDADGKGEIVVLEKDHDKAGNYLLTVMPYAERGQISDYSTTEIKLKSTPLRLFTGDFNNDGMTDLLVMEKDCAQIIKNHGGSKPYDSDKLEIITDLNVKDASLVEVGDFNGDGVPDFVLFGGKELTIALGNGNGHFSLCEPQTFDYLDTYGFKSEEARMMAYDFNHDGKTDIVIEKANMTRRGKYVDTRTFWLASDGTSFALSKASVSKRRDDAKGQRYVLGDFDGDGYPDLMNYGNQCLNATDADEEPRFYVYGNFSHPFEDKITHIDNGFDVDTYISYENPILQGIYKICHDAEYPVVDCVTPLPMVSCILKSEGALGLTEKKFRYEGLKRNVQGKGLLGISNFTVSDTSDNSLTKMQVTEYDKASFLPIHTRTTKVIGDFESISESTNKVENIIGKAFFCYTQRTEYTDFSGNRTTTENVYDTNKGCLKEKSETFDDGSYIGTRTDKFVYISGLWMPGSITVTKKHPDDAAEYTDVTKLVYDSKGNITSSTSHCGTEKEITNIFSYDDFGNVTSSAITADEKTEYSSCSEYSADGRFVVRKYTIPSTNEWQYSFDCFGNLLTETDTTVPSSPITTEHIYDSWGFETATVNATGNIVGEMRRWNDLGDRSFYTVDYGTGQPWTKTVYDRCGRKTYYETVHAGNLTETEVTEYTKAGNISSVKRTIGKLSSTTEMTYDELGRIIAESVSTGKDIRYEYGKRKVKVSDNGRIFTKDYDGWGNVKKSADPVSMVEYEYLSNGKMRKATCEGNSVSFEYDAAGNRTTLQDPDAGTISSEYDALGRLTKQRDGRGTVTYRENDAAGRIKSESGATDAVNYSYDSRGLVKSTFCGNNSESRQYDEYGRIAMILRHPEFSDIQSYGYKYDSCGLMSEETLPGGIKVSYSYDTYGNCVSKSIGSQCVWRLLSDDGITRKESFLGDKLVVESVRDDNGNQSKRNLKLAGRNIDGLYYQFDSKAGNLTSRSRKGGKYIENFKYDDLDRLISDTPMHQVADTAINLRPSTQTTLEDTSIDLIPDGSASWRLGDTFSYANNGNITETSTQGQYIYGDFLPHAVKTTSGKRSAAEEQTISYNDFNLPDGIMQGDGKEKLDLEYYYGTDNSRWHAEYYKGNNLYRTIDYGDGYEKVSENDTIREFWYLGRNVMLYRENGGRLCPLYLLTDNVGSVVGVYNEYGRELFRASYNPWGEMTVERNEIGMIRGYTGHEMLPEFQLVNMNGRLYDPTVCRFLSPDEYIQQPYNSQNYNRYSYCLNNPLKYSDPSGEYAFVDDIVAALLGGTLNLTINILSGNIHGGVWTCIGEGTVAFVSGAIGGVGALYPEFGGWAWGGAVCGAANSWLAGDKGWDIAKGAAIGALASGIGSYVCSSLSVAFGSISFSSVELTSPMVNGMVTGAFIGSLSGFTTDFAIALICGASLEEAFNASLEGALFGAASGSVSGISTGIRSARQNKVSPWNGEKINRHHPNPHFLGGKDDQELTPMALSRHKDLHSSLYKYLEKKTDGKGNDIRPRSGYPGITIQNNFDDNVRLNTMKEFYDRHPLTFWDARLDFYRNYNMMREWRPW